jgi:hypothetical protein
LFVLENEIRNLVKENKSRDVKTKSKIHPNINSEKASIKISDMSNTAKVGKIKEKKDKTPISESEYIRKAKPFTIVEQTEKVKENRKKLNTNLEMEGNDRIENKIINEEQNIKSENVLFEEKPLPLENEENYLELNGYFHYFV